MIFHQTKEEINSNDLLSLSNKIISLVRREINFKITSIEYLGRSNIYFRIIISPNREDPRGLSFASGPALDAVGTVLCYVSSYISCLDKNVESDIKKVMEDINYNKLINLFKSHLTFITQSFHYYYRPINLSREVGVHTFCEYIIKNQLKLTIQYTDSTNKKKLSKSIYHLSIVRHKFRNNV